MLGLPDGVTACLFDLDGVLTDTAAVHAQAWKTAFDAFLRDRPEPFATFTPADYVQHVDGLPRADGVRRFLASRDITLPEGDDGDGPDAPTVAGVGRRKNDLVLELIETEGVEVFPRSVAYLRAVREAGLRTAVVSSSANAREVLEITGLSGLLDVRVDGVVAKQRGLSGKPAPDTYLHAAELLGGGPAQAAVFEDALSGVAAGRAGGFARVIGVDRADQRAALREAGADVVVLELDELLGQG